MTKRNTFTDGSIPNAALITQMIIGGTVALMLISAFLMSAGEPNPEWAKYWRVMPLIIVPLAGAMGGAYYYYMVNMAGREGWQRIAMTAIGITGYVVALWLGTVLGLDGTYWD